MSLTSRLALLVLLALLGLGAAAASVARVRQESDSVREKTAFEQGDSVTKELLAKRDALSPDVARAMARGEPAPAELADFTAALLSPLVDASAGYCLRDGTLLTRETFSRREPLPSFSAPRFRPHLDEDEEKLFGRGPPHHRHRFPPMDRDLVMATCQEHGDDTPSHVRFAAPKDVLFVTVAGHDEPFAAWVLVRIPKRPHSPRPFGDIVLVAVIASAMLALVALSVDTVRRTRKEVQELADALVAAQDDLDAPIPRPTSRELGRIADEIRAMTAHLSESRKRELGLERTLAHERRLSSLGRVAAGVAHEIRNPLAGVKLRLDAMARRRLDERSARDVRRSLTEVARLDAVVGSLLLVARKEPAPLEDVDLALLVDERVAALEPHASRRSVRVRRSGGARARVDPIGLVRVIDNLVRNAVEASPEGSEVVVELTTSGPDVLLHVIDAGDGVPIEKEGELFEPFFTSKPDGTGLGLPLSRAAVEAHGGSLSYARRDGKTTFTVTLPGSALA